jgi:DNA-binding GntR family transcriptional regulator
MSEASLPHRLADRILAELRAGSAARGQHLAEQRLADRLRVSRSPVREALRLLESRGLVERHPNRGVFLAQDAAALEAVPAPEEAEETPYQRLVEDRLAGLLPERISESALARRYPALKRTRLLATLGRAEAEGWAMRLPGRGWAFPPVIASTEAYENAYRFRLVIEPAAMLEPGFRPDPVGFARLRAAQERLLGPALQAMARGELFAVNAAFHEGLIAMSGNPFLIEGLQRVNRLRRLVEYRVNTGDDRARVARMAEEHLRILDLLEAGEREAAAALMRTHLYRSRAARSAALDGSAN